MSWWLSAIIFWVLGFLVGVLSASLSFISKIAELEDFISHENLKNIKS